jgi:rhodanese-related sulfurtransferase
MQPINCGIRSNVVTYLAFLALVMVYSTITCAQESKSALPKEKQTVPGLYVTARQAYDFWKSTSGRVKILDVRTTEEFLFVGHAAMAWCIPLFQQVYVWDTEKNKFPMKPNPDFITQVKEIAAPSDTILVICRSGGRSAMAVNLLSEEGFKSVYNITDGMEGDMIDDTASVFMGQRLKNGWKNSGLPYTYEVVREKIKLPHSR